MSLPPLAPSECPTSWSAPWNLVAGALRVSSKCHTREIGGVNQSKSEPAGTWHLKCSDVIQIVNPALSRIERQLRVLARGLRTEIGHRACYDAAPLLLTKGSPGATDA